MTENNLMSSLGLDQVEADPNALPDGKWVGEVIKSEYVESVKNNTLSHVITYKVTDGDKTGAVRQEWFTLGTPIKDEAGNITGITSTMTEQAKPWYKKRWVDLGIPESQVSQAKPSDLVGKQVIFGTKKNGQYININFVELRNEVAAPVEGQVGNVLGSL